MQPGIAITIYHISLRDGTALFLHPFVKSGDMIELGSSVELVGRYGREPRVESVTMLRNDLYRRIENDVRDWINERRFIPRFLLAAAAFLVVYLFLSVVIRDPLPVLDEMLIGLGVAVVTFIVVGRRFEQSRAAARRRVTLRSKVDAVVFSEDPFVYALEGLVQKLEERDPLESETSEEIRSAAEELYRTYPAETSDVIHHLRSTVAAKPYRSLARQIKHGRIGMTTREQIEQGILVPSVVRLLKILVETQR